MEKSFPEIVFSSSDSKTSMVISRAVQAGKLRKIAQRLYTSNLEDSPESIVLRNRYHILGELYPEAVISHRSALEGGSSPENRIVLSYKYTKKVKLPGLTILLVEGPGPLEGDTPFINNLYLASRPRAFLENLRPGKKIGADARCMPQEFVEEKLELLLRIHGKEALNELRDEAKDLSLQLNLKKEFTKLNKIIGALQSTKESKGLKSETGRARAKGLPYDPHRLELFANLKALLSVEPIKLIHEKEQTSEWLRNLAFFESYFSNYIEGTRFKIGEAVDIIFNNKIIAGRPEDSHDILSTFRITSSTNEMNKIPGNYEELLQLLKSRHFTLMEGRDNVHPGHFKEKANRAGSTVFVVPELVMGTLKKGFELYESIKPGLPSAIFMMFLVSEVHPFVDGNGRIARIMMNAELVSAKQCRIIIPTVYREDYLSVLRRLSRSGDPDPFIRVLIRAQKFTAAINFMDYKNALELLKASNAFEEPTDAKLIFPAEG